ncbi:CBS domain-containing protein, partial [Streptomyces sp. NPDC001139]
MPESPYTVSDVMTQTVIAVGRDASFKEVVGLIDQWKVSALPVLVGEGRVVGVVSEADLLPKEEFRDGGEENAERTEREKAAALTAGELMSTPAVTVHADASVAEAARIMARRHRGLEDARRRGQRAADARRCRGHPRRPRRKIV